MPQSYTPELKKKIVRLHLEEGAPTKVLLQNTAYPKPIFPNGAVNSVKNAKPKTISILLPWTKQNLWKRI